MSRGRIDRYAEVFHVGLISLGLLLCHPEIAFKLSFLLPATEDLLYAKYAGCFHVSYK